MSSRKVKEIGFMTKEEFLEYSNPGDKHHPSNAYEGNFDLWNIKRPSTYGEVKVRFTIYSASFFNDGGIIIKRDDKEIALISNNILYHDGNFSPQEIPNTFFNTLFTSKENFNISYTKSIPVKYIGKHISKYLDNSSHVLDEFGNLINTIDTRVGRIRIMSETKPENNIGATIVLITDKDHIVGMASSEWGATLVQVSPEYRGIGLGQMLSEIWYRYNPSYESGGFTPDGELTALRRWSSRVRELLANGTYSKLTKEGKITKEKTIQILSELEERPKPKKIKPKGTQPKKKINLMLHADDYIFYIYDSNFFESNDESDILAYGFLRESENIGFFLFRMEYEEKFGEILLMMVLQFLRNENEKLYVGKGYRDFFDEEIIENINRNYDSPIVRDGDYIFLNKDLINLTKYLLTEKKFLCENFRTANERHEKVQNLIEIAESKW